MLRHERSDIGKKIMSYFIGIIMVFSVFGVIFFGFATESTNSVKYKRFKFIDKGSFWSVKVNGKEALFTYLPEETASIDIESSDVDKLKNIVQIDTTSEFNDTLAKHIALAQFQMGAALNNFGVYLRSGFIGNISNFPTIRCEDSNNFVPVIYFRTANETKIYSDGLCLRAEAANGADVLKLKDRMVYGILGII